MTLKVAETSSVQIKEHPSIWRNRSFLYIWSGHSIAMFTFHIFTLIVPIIIYQLTQSTLAMSSMRAIEFLPNILLGVFIGALVDRINRKHFMIGALLLKIAALTTLITLLYFGVQLWHIYLLGFLIYTSLYSFATTYHTVLPLIVSKDQLTSANSSILFMNTLINFIGPAVAGFIIAYLSYSAGLAITLIGFVVLLFFVSLMRLSPSEEGDKGVDEPRSSNIWSDVKEGWKQLISTKSLWMATLMVLVYNYASASSGAVLIFYALDEMHVTSKELGLIFSAAAIGGMLASLAAKPSRKWSHRGKLFLLSYAIAFVGQMVLFFSSSWYWLSVGMFFMGFGVTFFNVHYLTLRQESTPNHLLGRVAGTSSMIMKCAMPLGYLIAGALGEVIPVHYVFLLSASILFIIIIVSSRTSIMELR